MIFAPKISILIAARNEEKNILHCLKSLENQTIDKNCWEVWIGDDASDDNTAQVVADFIHDKPNYHLVRISETWGNARGKSNVLAQLTRQANGRFFLTTDADVILPRRWIETLMTAHIPGVGIVSGATIPENLHYFAAMQALDWVLTAQVIKQLADFRIPVTATGSNMLITREAYEATGGYENLPFSITEDDALFHEVLKKGYRFKQLYNADSLAFTFPMDTLRQWLQQRKRWANGVTKLPWYGKLTLFLPLLFLVQVVATAFTAPLDAWLVFMVPTVALWGYLSVALRRLSLRRLQKYVWTYPFYWYLSFWAMIIYYFWPVKVQWKGRAYS